MLSSVLLDGALIDSELGGKVIDRNPVGIALDQLLDPGWLETPTDLSMAMRRSPLVATRSPHPSEWMFRSWPA